jgi:transposase
MFTLGIDVSKDTLDAALFDGRKFKTRKFCNTSAGIASLQGWLTAASAQGCAVGMEATGSYSEAVACALHDAGHRVSVLNPARIAAFVQTELGRGKTDALDAKRIARFTVLHQPPRWEPPPQAVRVLQALVRRLDSLKDLRQQESNRLLTAHPSVQPSLHAIIASLDAQIDAIQRAIGDHIDQDPDLHQKRDLLESIPGISTRTSAVLLSHLQALERCTSAKQWVAYAGLDCAVAQSGTSLQRRGHISKRGPASLRAALYMPAISACQHNPLMTPFAQRLRAAGKPGLVRVCAAMRKLMHIVFGVLKHQTPFDPGKLAMA